MSLEAANAAPDPTTVRLDGTRTGAGRSDGTRGAGNGSPPGPVALFQPGPQPGLRRCPPRRFWWVGRWAPSTPGGASSGAPILHSGRDRSRRRQPGEAFLAEGPECLTALRYVLVDDDPASRERQRAHLPIESPILVLGPVGPDDQDDFDDRRSGRFGTRGADPAVVGIGPLVTSLTEPPVVEGPAFVVAIGWASRLPSDRLEWRDGRWWEIRPRPPDQTGRLSELPVPLDRSRAASAEQLAGAEVPPLLAPTGPATPSWGPSRTGWPGPCGWPNPAGWS